MYDSFYLILKKGFAMSELDDFDSNKLNSIFEKITTIESLEVFSEMLFLVDISSEVYSEFLDKVNAKRNEIENGVNMNLSNEISEKIKLKNEDKNKDKTCLEIIKEINSFLDKDELTEEECKELYRLYKTYKDKGCGASVQVIAPLTPTHTLSSRKQPGADSKNNTIDKHKLRQKLEKCGCSDIV